MTRYFFHLRFGHRVVWDEEGTELSNRSAARSEALAAVCELAEPNTGRPSRRWAGWFLQVVDEFGEFFRTPVGHPALELVGPNDPTAVGQRATSSRAEVVETRSPIKQRTVQLLERTLRLHEELSLLCSNSEKLLLRSREVVAQARLTRQA